MARKTELPRNSQAGAVSAPQAGVGRVGKITPAASLEPIARGLASISKSLIGQVEDDIKATLDASVYDAQQRLNEAFNDPKSTPESLVSLTEEVTKELNTNFPSPQQKKWRAYIKGNVEHHGFGLAGKLQTAQRKAQLKANEEFAELLFESTSSALADDMAELEWLLSGNESALTPDFSNRVDTLRGNINSRLATFATQNEAKNIDRETRLLKKYRPALLKRILESDPQYEDNPQLLMEDYKAGRLKDLETFVVNGKQIPMPFSADEVQTAVDKAVDVNVTKAITRKNKFETFTNKLSSVGNVSLNDVPAEVFVELGERGIDSPRTYLDTLLQKRTDILQTGTVNFAQERIKEVGTEDPYVASVFNALLADMTKRLNEDPIQYGIDRKQLNENSTPEQKRIFLEKRKVGFKYLTANDVAIVTNTLNNYKGVEVQTNNDDGTVNKVSGVDLQVGLVGKTLGDNADNLQASLDIAKQMGEYSDVFLAYALGGAENAKQLLHGKKLIENDERYKGWLSSRNRAQVKLTFNNLVGGVGFDIDMLLNASYALAATTTDPSTILPQDLRKAVHRLMGGSGTNTIFEDTRRGGVVNRQGRVTGIIANPSSYYKDVETFLSANVTTDDNWRDVLMEVRLTIQNPDGTSETTTSNRDTRVTMDRMMRRFGSYVIAHPTEAGKFYIEVSHPIQGVFQVLDASTNKPFIIDTNYVRYDDE